jgi:hypothetical protein
MKEKIIELIEKFIMKTKLLSIFVFICSGILINVSAQNPGDNIFSGTQIFNINIKFSQPDYWDLLVYYYSLGTEVYIPADVIINNNDTLLNVGVRLKGHSSYSHPNNKKSIRLGFDEFDGALRWDGLKGVHLNNYYGDPTFMREKIHLDFCRDAGIVAPRANYANVFINDTLFAFYSLIEHVDKTFLNTRFGNKNGDFFKAIDGFEGTNILSDFCWYTSVPDSYYNRYELKNNGAGNAWQNLVAFIDSLVGGEDTDSYLTENVNLSSLYNAFAADIIFANLDSYINSSRNFYFYFNTSTGKMEWIKWDVGLSFGCYSGGVSNFENLSITYIINESQRPLFGKILSSPLLKNDYLEDLAYLNSNYFNTSTLFQHIDSTANLIRTFVYADPRKQYTNLQFEQNIINDLNISGVGGTSRIPGLKSFISARKNSINTQLGLTGIDDAGNVIPGEFKLYQNYPNPFNPSTNIQFVLPSNDFVTLKVFDLMGREVSTLLSDHLNAGTYAIEFNASSLSSGIYFYRLSSSGFNQSKQMLLIK